MTRWVCHVYLCTWVESGSGPFICTIETLKCFFEKICHFLVYGCRGAIRMEQTLNSGTHPFVAAYISGFLWDQLG